MTIVFLVLPYVVVVTVCSALTFLLWMSMLPSLLAVVKTEEMVEVLLEEAIFAALQGEPEQGQWNFHILLW